MSVTFEVNTVEKASEALPVIPDNLLRVSGEKKRILDVSITRCFVQIEARSIPIKPLVQVTFDNYFLGAIHLAFAEHYPLILSPDHIWLVLLQGFGQHIRLHQETFREQIVGFEGKRLIHVVHQNFLNGDSTDQWQAVFQDFATEIRRQIPVELGDVFQADFSTSGQLEATIFNMALMYTMKSYFRYMMTLCGIPNITLEGTVQDWQKIYAKMQGFRTYGLAWWVDELEPLIQEFILAAQGQANPVFWQSIYKHHSASGGEELSGWILAFFPYVNQPRDAMTQNPYFQKANQQNWRIKLGAIPAGSCTIPFTYRAQQDDEMLLEAGFRGISQDPESLAVRPELAWVMKKIIKANPNDDEVRQYFDSEMRNREALNSGTRKPPRTIP